MADEGRRFLGEYLVAKGLLTQEQLNEAVEESRRIDKPVGMVLLRRGFVSEKEMAQALSEQLEIPLIELSTYDVAKECVALVPEKVCRQHILIPIFKIGDSLSVAMSDPLNITVVDQLNKLTRLRIQPALATISEINAAIDKYYGKGKKAAEPAAKEAPAAEEASPELKQMMQQAGQSQVIKTVDEIIISAVEEGASDIHLEPDEKNFYCRYRIDGVLKDKPLLAKDQEAAVLSRVKIMASMDIAEKRLPQDGRIQQKIKDREIDLRISTFPTLFGENVVIRILNKSQGIMTLDRLGFNKDNLEIFRKTIHRPYGMVLVTGPTGSGKSTTLYAALQEIDAVQQNILTLEDPVEYRIERVRQSQVNIKAGLTFDAGLRSMLRQDPDVIMIGEIRDRETAEIAIHAALTGHLVFSSLHTNDAASAPTRLIDMGVEPFLVASSLIAVVAQRLIRVLCPECKKPYIPDEEVLKPLGIKEWDKSAKVFQEGSCRNCRNLGFKGRIGIFELLVPNDEIKQLIAAKSSSVEIAAAARKAGMKGLREDGMDKVKQSITSIAEILQATE